MKIAYIEIMCEIDKNQKMLNFVTNHSTGKFYEEMQEIQPMFLQQK